MTKTKKELSGKLMLILAIVLIILSACAKTQLQITVPDNIKSNAMNFVEFPNVKAPDFKLIDQNGKELTTEKMKSKVYLIQGYSFGCSSCAQEVATLNKVWEKYKDKDVEIISMDLFSEDIKDALETKKLYHGGDWHWTLDKDNVAVKMGMTSLETTIIIDKDGIIRYKDEIISNSDDLSKEIDKLI